MSIYEDVTLSAGTIKRIHVNQFVIKRFHKDGVDEPAWIVRTSNGVYYCRHWSVDGPLDGIQRLGQPMPGCSARLWLETTAEVVLEQAEKAQEDTCLLAA